MTLESAKEIWDFLKEEYQGDERIKCMKVMNLIREFEMQRMKESGTIKEFSDRLLIIVNKEECWVLNFLIVGLSRKFL